MTTATTSMSSSPIQAPPSRTPPCRRPTTRTTTPRRRIPFPTTRWKRSSADGIVSWSEADAVGLTGDVEWGDRCDTDLGTYAYPDFFAGECVVPFEGDNGGATETGVTADTITIAVYTAPRSIPSSTTSPDPINNDDTPDEVFETHAGLAEFYGSFFETYGRTVELVQYPATGTSDDEVAAIADAETIARDIQPFMVWSAPTLQAEVVRRDACGERRHVQLPRRSEPHATTTPISTP